MRKRSKALAWVLSAAALAAGSASAAPVTTQRLTAFGSSVEMAAWVAHRSQDEQADCPPHVPDCLDSMVEELVVTGSRISAPSSITNNQEAGVDEGDIVKMRGDTLIILRRGRLFTVDTANGGLKAVDSIDAYPPGVTPDADGDDWYDEMLVSGDWVVVIGYSYGRGGTEINRFRLDRRGRLTFVDSHHLSSNDYYSSRNYASCLVGTQLVVYAPIEVDTAEEALADLPALVRWREDGRGVRRRLVEAKDVYQAPPLPGTAEAEVNTLHAVTRCDLAQPRLICRATAILGPWSRTFYVAPDAIYVWMTHDRPRGAKDGFSSSLIYRVPLDGAAPQAARARGAPVDQFSFAEDAASGLLRVLVRSEGGGDAMWRAEFSDGGVALLTLPLSRFGDGAAEARSEDYRMLGLAPDNGWRMLNRFTPDHVIYSFSGGDRSSSDGGQSLISIAALDPAGPLGQTPMSLLASGVVERIEPVGQDALIVSRETDHKAERSAVVFRSLDLNTTWNDRRSPPRLSHTYRLTAAKGAETRSHAFFYQPDMDRPDGERGVMGLPVVRTAGPSGDGAVLSDDLFDDAADMAFLRRGQNRVSPLGVLLSDPAGQMDDGCTVSCVDWYGDARPIFVGNRIFALLGYELVEGVERERSIRELRRVSFAPSARARH